MECPYCHNEMRAGGIPADRVPVQWRPEGYDSWLAAPGDERVRLSPTPFLSAQAEAWYCADCRVVIVPVKEFETAGDRLARKWNGFTEKVGRALDGAAAGRAEKKREKRAEARRKKDPWEVD